MEDLVDMLQGDFGLRKIGKSTPISTPKSSLTSSYSSSSIYDTPTVTNRQENNSSFVYDTPSVTNRQENNENNSSFVYDTPSVRDRQENNGKHDHLSARGGIKEKDLLFGTSMDGLSSFQSKDSEQQKVTPLFHDDNFINVTKKPTKLHQHTVKYDNIFDMQSEVEPSSPKMSSSSISNGCLLPVFDAPLYDDDIFGGIPGIKSNTNVIYDGVFGHGTNLIDDLFGVSTSIDSKTAASHMHPMTAPGSADMMDDLFGVSKSINSKGAPLNMLPRMESGSSNGLNNLFGVPSNNVSKDMPLNRHLKVEAAVQLVHDSDELLPGFGSAAPTRPWKSNSVPLNSEKGTHSKGLNDSFNVYLDDPFIILDSTVPPSTVRVPGMDAKISAQSTGMQNRHNSNDVSHKKIPVSGNASQHGTTNPSTSGKKMDRATTEKDNGQIDIDFFESRKDRTSYSPAKENTRSSTNTYNHFEGSPILSRKNIKNSDEAIDSRRNKQEFNEVNHSRRNKQDLDDTMHSQRNKQDFDEADENSWKLPKSVLGRTQDKEVWVAVEAVKLVTKPTAMPPPSRMPPQLPNLKQNYAKMSQRNANVKEEDPDTSVLRVQMADRKDREVTLADQEMMEGNEAVAASASAMEQAMARGRSNPHVNEKEEKEADSGGGSIREDKELDSDTGGDDGLDYEDAKSEFNEREEEEREERSNYVKEETKREEKGQKDTEKQQNEREKEKKKESGERGQIDAERAHQVSYERTTMEKATAEAQEREATKAKQRTVVETVTSEVRERAAVEARQRTIAQRAAVERANAEVRERAYEETRERAAEQRAVVEARQKASLERAAVERATAEARERAAIGAREKASLGKAAVERATAEARERAAVEARAKASLERATVERVISEARGRAAVEARERVANAEKAAVERAMNEARARAERAAVEKANSEARQRAAERAAADAREKAEKTAAERVHQKTDDDFEAYFSSSSRANSASRPRSPSNSSKEPSNEGSQKSSNVSATASKVTTTSLNDDWTSLFGVASTPGEFQEINGETAERRRGRLERYQRTAERAAKALDEKNQRDLQSQRDQEERHRVGDVIDSEIKRWAAGKEGNLRALLSTLQYVLWPDCGWHAVSLTDLITAASVKKVYRKATLCVHPDKVQQKGATIQQKYIAEKVFDLLKEAWNKFNSEELF